MTGGGVSVCVVGSFMVDLVMRVARRPQRGETVQADAFGIFLGGKGFNQAIAARRMGTQNIRRSALLTMRRGARTFR